MEVEIKPATIENLKDIQKLHLMLLKREYKKFDSTLDYEWTFSEEGEKYFKGCILDEDGCVFAAYIDGKVIGYLAASIDKENFKLLPKFSELESIYILRKYRGMNIGSKLYDAFVEWSKSRGANRLRVSPATLNVKAINFYRKIGFTDHYLIMETTI